MLRREEEGKGKLDKVKQVTIDELKDAKMSTWVTNLFDFVKSSFGNINSKVQDVLTAEAKDKGMSEEDAKAEGEKEFKQRMPFNGAMADFFDGVGKQIENGLAIFPGIIKLFSSVVQANKFVERAEKKNLKPYKRWRLNRESKVRKPLFPNAIAYSGQESISQRMLARRRIGQQRLCRDYLALSQRLQRLYPEAHL